LKILHSLKQYTEITKKFFAFRISNVFTGHAQMKSHLCTREGTTLLVPIFTQLTTAE